MSSGNIAISVSHCPFHLPCDYLFSYMDENAKSLNDFWVLSWVVQSIMVISGVKHILSSIFQNI